MRTNDPRPSPDGRDFEERGDVSKRILKLVQSDDLRRSKSDKLLAHYIERNIADLPFETARSIAQRAGAPSTRTVSGLP